MTITRIGSEQARLKSSRTGEHVLDTYLEACEKGDRPLFDLLDDLFDDGTGLFRSELFSFRIKDEGAGDYTLQFRVGVFVDPEAGWVDISDDVFTDILAAAKDFRDQASASATSAGNSASAASTSETNSFNSAGNSASSAISSSTSATLSGDWANKTSGVVASSEYSAKAYALGGTGVTNTSGKGAAKEWATTTGGTVDTTENSAKAYAQENLTTGGRNQGGSAKDWAVTAEDTVVSGGEYSAKHYAAKAALSAGGGLAKVSTNDTTAGYLNGKLVAGSEIVLTENNDGGNETLTIAVDTGTSGDKVGKLNTANTYSAAQRGAPISLTQASTIAVDLALGNHFYTTMTGNRTLGQPSNMTAGQSGTIEIIQDGTGSRTLAYHADWLFPGGTDPVLSTAAGSKDLLCYQVNQAGNKVYANLLKGFA